MSEIDGIMKVCAVLIGFSVIYSNRIEATATANVKHGRFITWFIVINIVDFFAGVFLFGFFKILFGGRLMNIIFMAPYIVATMVIILRSQGPMNIRALLETLSDDVVDGWAWVGAFLLWLNWFVIEMQPFNLSF